MTSTAGVGTPESYAAYLQSQEAFATVIQMGRLPLFVGAFGLTVPGQYWYSVITASFQYISDATLGVRIPGLSVRDADNNVVSNVFAANGQDPSQSVQYSAWPGTTYSGAKNDNQQMPFPVMLIPSSFSLVISTNNAGAGDVIPQSEIYVQKIPTGSSAPPPEDPLPTPVTL